MEPVQTACSAASRIWRPSPESATATRRSTTRSVAAPVVPGTTKPPAPGVEWDPHTGGRRLRLTVAQAQSPLSGGNLEVFTMVKSVTSFRTLLAYVMLCPLKFQF